MKNTILTFYLLNFGWRVRSNQRRSKEASHIDDIWGKGDARKCLTITACMPACQLQSVVTVGQSFKYVSPSVHIPYATHLQNHGSNHPSVTNASAVHMGNPGSRRFNLRIRARSAALTIYCRHKNQKQPGCNHQLQRSLSNPAGQAT